MSNSAIYRNGGKRALDVVLSLLGLVVLSPVMLIVALALKLKQGGQVFFRQDRPGLNDQVFTMIKFRTMLDTVNAEGELLEDHERLTDIGTFVRRTSLDEIPELWNVLRGEMSIVGPRPLLTEYLDRYSDHHRRRHEVRPGITGWAQVSGRQTIPFSQRLDLDVWYVDNLSLSLDLEILRRTILQVIQNRGVVVGQSVDEVDDLGLSNSVLSKVEAGEQRGEH